MVKRELKIINFLHLDEEHYNKIREYRNQDFIRKVSFNSEVISEEEHKNYKKLLEERKGYFAFLITCNEKDYAVISLKKIDEETFFIGEYLVNESYQYEGGGVVIRYCVLYLCTELRIKYLQYNIKYGNKRGLRTGFIGEAIDYKENVDSFYEVTKMVNFYDNDVLKVKSRKLFDKLYKIDCLVN